MTTRASGTFEVRMSPQAPDEGAEGVGIGRMLIDKRFEGDLEGTSRGQMLAAGTGVAGSAGYVAMEQVTGRLGGRSGTFVLQHSGTMSRGAARLTVSVVPDSGRDELEGLTGTMDIVIEEGQHSYVFDYALGNAVPNS
jgi:hypothetical protein